MQTSLRSIAFLPLTLRSNRTGRFEVRKPSCYAPSGDFCLKERLLLGGNTRPSILHVSPAGLSQHISGNLRFQCWLEVLWSRYMDGFKRSTDAAPVIITQTKLFKDQTRHGRLETFKISESVWCFGQFNCYCVCSSARISACVSVSAFWKSRLCLQLSSVTADAEMGHWSTVHSSRLRREIICP